MVKTIITGLLSAALILVAQQAAPDNFNNSVTRQTAEAAAVMPEKQGKAEVANQAPATKAFIKTEPEQQPQRVTPVGCVWSTRTSTPR